MTTTPRSTRRIALDAMARIRDGGFANLVVPAALARTDLAPRDRGFVTELVYGTTRMQRACDFLVDRFLYRPGVDPDVRDALRLGAYQLAFLGTPPHAAVGATVDEVSGGGRGLVNAVLRKVAAALPLEQTAWPDDATRLSYPDWIVDRLVADLGRDAALGALEQMNVAAAVHERVDGYVQDPASEAVAAYVGAQPGELVIDLCAAPGGKATAMAHAQPALVVALDVHPSRAALVAGNARTTGTATVVSAVVADGRAAPLRQRVFDRVLVDAPCSGLGVLRRRPDARWRIEQGDVDALGALQRELLGAAATLVKPGGVLVYSVCTLTDAEGPAVDRWLATTYPEWKPLPPPPSPWEPCGRGALLLPQTAGTDGMFVAGLRAPADLS